MAYSDYGGYAYRNGLLVIDRSDAVLSPDGIKSTPGQWPGWTLKEGRDGGSHHVLLGDGPIFVSLYKQSYVGVYRLGDSLDLVPLLDGDFPDDAIYVSNSGQKSIKYDYFRDNKLPCNLAVDGHKVQIVWKLTDNYYCFARIEQPDGAFWCGFSGYGVGAGFEGSERCIEELSGIWPDAVKDAANPEGVCCVLKR